MHRALIAVAAGALLVGCGGKTCPEPYYDGVAHDEALRAMVDAASRAVADELKAAKFSFPTDGEKLNAAGAAPTFTWTSTLVASGARPSPQRRSSLARIGEWLYPSAWAHGPPVTGQAHYLRITVPNRMCPLEVITTKTTWIPSDAAWNELKTFTSGTLTLDAFSAYLTNNRITEGPYRLSKPLSITVAK